MQLGNFGIWQIVIIVLVILLIVGPRRLPHFVKSVGQTFFQFRREVRTFKRDIDIFADDDDDEPARPRRRNRPRPLADEASAPRGGQAEPGAGGESEAQGEQRVSGQAAATASEESTA